MGDLNEKEDKKKGKGNEGIDRGRISDDNVKKCSDI